MYDTTLLRYHIYHVACEDTYMAPQDPSLTPPPPLSLFLSRSLSLFLSLVTPAVVSRPAAVPHLQESVDVSHAQAGKLFQVSLALRSVYQLLLRKESPTHAFEETSRWLEVPVSTIKTWERMYRNKGYIKVRAANCSLSLCTHMSYHTSHSMLCL